MGLLVFLSVARRRHDGASRPVTLAAGLVREVSFLLLSPSLPAFSLLPLPHERKLTLPVHLLHLI
jgi:hypothetical protein